MENEWLNGTETVMTENFPELLREQSQIQEVY